MTVNQKHHIEMLIVRRSKKKVDRKLKKLQELTLEMKVWGKRGCNLGKMGLSLRCNIFRLYM